VLKLSFLIAESMFVQWDFAFGGKHNLTWCAGNCALGPQLVPVPVEGDLEEPFALVSVKAGDSITLRAVNFFRHVYYTSQVCRYDDQILRDCRSETKVTYFNASGEFPAPFIKPLFSSFDYSNL
jgi:hypothetical protein